MAAATAPQLRWLLLLAAAIALLATTGIADPQPAETKPPVRILKDAAPAAKAPKLKAVKLSFPPFTSALNCSLANAEVPARDICTPSSGPNNPPPRIIFSYDNGVVSARYAHKKKVQLYKRKTRYAASFSTSYTIQFRRSSDRRESDNFFAFGGGWAFAITPDQRVGDSGPESLGLFEIDLDTGKSLRGADTRTVAVALDVSRATSAEAWDKPDIPHLELDINSVASVKSVFLWDRPAFFDRKIAVFIDYDARQEALAVRLQNLTDTSKPRKKDAKLWLSYQGLKLSDYVNEKSIVGFSSRVPETEDGTYILYDWKFSTKWVLTKKLH